MDEQPFISVVIPVWNSPDLIAKCLAAMAAQTYPRDRFEVLVVDNGSTDETAEVARSVPFVTLLSEPIASSYRARNRGLRSARGEYVAFTDADCVPGPQWLAAAGRAARQHPHAAVLAGHIELFRADTTGSAACEKYEYAFAFDQGKNASHGVCVTANWLSPRRVLLDFGGFDEHLNSGGDWSLCRRIRAAGQPIVYVPDMLVRHPVRGNLAKLAAKRRRTIGGYWRSTGKRWRFLWCSAVLIRRTITRTIGTASDRRFTFADRLRVIGVVMALSTVGMVELIRLACGGETRRI
ncbi:MAG: glycosyltransferase [Rhodospirillales bacterium]|nr:glycosyltransferase [Rhodospirillales bacterium]